MEFCQSGNVGTLLTGVVEGATNLPPSPPPVERQKICENITLPCTTYVVGTRFV